MPLDIFELLLLNPKPWTLTAKPWTLPAPFQEHAMQLSIWLNSKNDSISPGLPHLKQGGPQKQHLVPHSVKLLELQTATDVK